MHYFPNASNHGYPAVVGYLRLVDDTGKIHCAFRHGKDPQLPTETMINSALQAAVVATCLHLLLSEELEVPFMLLHSGYTPCRPYYTLQTRRSDSTHSCKSTEWKPLRLCSSTMATCANFASPSRRCVQRTRPTCAKIKLPLAL